MVNHVAVHEGHDKGDGTSSMGAAVGILPPLRQYGCSGKSSRDRKVMHLLRCMHFFMARHDIRLKAVHVPGVSNSRADTLSWNNVPLFMRITPQTKGSQTMIPENLWALVVESEVDWLSTAWRSKLVSL